MLKGHRIIWLTVIIGLIVGLPALWASPVQEVSGVEGTDYPTRPIRLIIPSRPGGDIDQNGRLLSARIGDYLGQPFVPVNISDAGGNLALQQLIESNADGYTFVYFNSAFFTFSASGRINYSLEDVQPVCTTSMSDTLIFVTSSKSPYQTVDDLARALREKPGTVTYAATLGAPSQFQGVAVERAAGGKFKKFDTGSGSAKTVALVSGQVDFISTTVGLMRDYLESGEVTAVASICESRSELAPDIPTFNEMGVNLGQGFGAKYMLLAKPGTPDYVVEKVVSAITEMMQNGAVAKEFRNSYFVPEILSGNELVTYSNDSAAYYKEMSEAVANDRF